MLSYLQITFEKTFILLILICLSRPKLRTDERLKYMGPKTLVIQRSKLLIQMARRNISYNNNGHIPSTSKMK